MLVRGGEIGAPGLQFVAIQAFDDIEERGLQPREREVEPRDLGNREREGLSVAVLREPIDRRAARVAEAEQPRTLVERLPRRVVECRPEQLVRTALPHGQQLRMAAAREQAEERRLDLDRVEIKRGNVSVEVVDWDQRQLARPRECLRSRNADEERTHESRPLCDGDGLDLRERDAAAVERLAHHRPDELEVAARRDLRHDAAVARVQLILRRDNRCPHLTGRGHERRGGLVTRRLDPEDHGNSSPAGPFHMTSASSRLSV